MLEQFAYIIGFELFLGWFLPSSFVTGLRSWLAEAAELSRGLTTIKMFVLIGRDTCPLLTYVQNRLS